MEQLYSSVSKTTLCWLALFLVEISTGGEREECSKQTKPLGVRSRDKRTSDFSPQSIPAHSVQSRGLRLPLLDIAGFLHTYVNSEKIKYTHNCLERYLICVETQAARCRGKKEDQGARMIDPHMLPVAAAAADSAQPRWCSCIASPTP